MLWRSCLYPGSTAVSSYCPSVEDPHRGPSLLFLVPPGDESRLRNVAGAHLRLEAWKLGQGKGQPASVLPLHAFRGSHHGAVPNPPQEQSSLFYSPKEAGAAQEVGAVAGGFIYPERGTWRVGYPRKEKGC